ncbi:Predicted membrane protein [Serratia fonticola]|uniref:J domain-containing protein n=1 Tax=Serratia fonticola TaxID=47917 RepID=UPI00217935DB|nr:J domain-containing protein [Serratia fonticola]CAI2007271.1 Predicted membrane protein [Serratia fonticola]
MNQRCWQILGIEPTEDQQAIRAAYRSKLPDHHPENDPSGFQLLRQAFEHARKLAETPFMLRSAQSTEDDGPHDVGTAQLEQAPEPPPSAAEPLFESMLAQFDALLNTPETRYQPQSWHRYIAQLDQYDIALIDRLRWYLLDRVYHSPCISTDCVRLLADRLNWRHRLNELEQDDAARMDDYLDYIARADIFDLSTLSSISLPAQLETVAFFRHAYHLYWNEPEWMLRLLLSNPSVIYWPDCPRLMKQLAQWYSLAEVPSETLRDHCLAQLELDAENSDWLYLAARHCALLQDNQRAFDYWLQLYRLQQHAQAEQGLLDWCREQHPAYLPLLIQAFDRPVYPAAAGIAADDEMQDYLTPTQTVQTLVRWGEAAQFNWAAIPIAQAFIDWKSDNSNVNAMYGQLVLDDGTDPLRLLYRHASMLTLGGEGLLQQIIDQPTPNDPLQALILRGLQLQAAQRLAWLRDSSVIANFIQWLDGPIDHELPERYTDTGSASWHQAVFWLRQWRYLSPARLNRLYQTPALGSKLESVNMKLCYLAVEDQIEIPAFNDATAPWEQYRQNCLLVILLNDAARQIDNIRQINPLRLSEQHPAYELYQLIRQLDTAKGDLVWQFEQQLQLDNRLHYLCWLELPVSISQFLLRLQNQLELCNCIDAAYFYRKVSSWRQEIEQAPMAEQALFHAFLLRHGSQEVKDRSQAALEQLDCCDQEEINLKQALLNHKKPKALGRSTLFARGSLLTKIAHVGYHLYENYRDNLEQDEHQQLMAGLENSNLSPILRLNAGLLVQLSFQRAVKSQRVKEQRPDTRFWQFWQFDRRINRLGLLAQLTLVPLAMVAVYLLLINVLSAWVIIGLLLLNTFSALLRRSHDLNRKYPVFEAVLLICMPYLILLYLLIPGVKHANQYGPPPGEKR